MTLIPRLSFSGLLFWWLLLAPFASVLARPAFTSSNLDSAPAGTSPQVLRGRASWYGREHQGARTSNGERFNRHEYTCAHRTLPFGTRLRVTNPQTGKAVVVRVTDRGPFRNQRILDLSEAAAQPLSIVCCGAVDVIAEVVSDKTPLGPTGTPRNLAALKANEPAPVAAAEPEPAKAPAKALTWTGPYLVQAGTFADPANAKAMQARIQGLDAKLQVQLTEETIEGRVLNRVLIGSFADRPEAEAVRRRLQVWGVGGLVREVARL